MPACETQMATCAEQPETRRHGDCLTIQERLDRHFLALIRGLGQQEPDVALRAVERIRGELLVWKVRKEMCA